MTAMHDGGSGLRERIIDEATRLFADKGFSATSIRELVEACRCTKPSLYYYFHSKESLFSEVVKLHVDTILDMGRTWVDSPGSVRERTHKAIEGFIDHASSHPHVMRLLQRIETRPEEDAPAFNIMATREFHLQLLSSLMEQGIAVGQIRNDALPLECALVIAGTLSFQFEMALATGSWERDRIHRTVDLIFDGIAP